MLAGSKTKIPYAYIDYEIRDLIRYMNAIDGIETTGSCCGHGNMPCFIYFKADNIECVTKFVFKYLYRDPNWRVIVDIADSEIDNEEWDNPTYRLETTIRDFYYNGLAIDNFTYRLRIE